VPQERGDFPRLPCAITSPLFARGSIGSRWTLDWSGSSFPACVGARANRGFPPLGGVRGALWGAATSDCFDRARAHAHPSLLLLYDRLRTGAMIVPGSSSAQDSQARMPRMSGDRANLRTALAVADRHHVMTRVEICSPAVRRARTETSVAKSHHIDWKKIFSVTGMGMRYLECGTRVPNPSHYNSARRHQIITCNKFLRRHH